MQIILVLLPRYKSGLGFQISPTGTSDGRFTIMQTPHLPWMTSAEQQQQNPGSICVTSALMGANLLDLFRNKRMHPAAAPASADRHKLKSKKRIPSNIAHDCVFKDQQQYIIDTLYFFA